MAPTHTTRNRTLLLADWQADPDAVLAACVGRIDTGRMSVDLVVPAALHGIDWVGDPYANLPCARRALDDITRLLRSAGIEVTSATVGDHDPIAAAVDATLSQAPEQILVCGLKRRIKLFDLGDRVRRVTRLPVISTPVPRSDRRPHGWLRLRRGECETTQARDHVSRHGWLAPASH